jgi:hypothetical protein
MIQRIEEFIKPVSDRLYPLKENAIASSQLRKNAKRD